MSSNNCELTSVSTVQLHSVCLSTAKSENAPESMLVMFDDIWAKLLMLAKQLRDTLQFYNQKKQELGWGLEVNTLITKRKAIEDSYTAAEWSAAGSILGGILMVGFCVKGGEQGSVLGQVAGQSTSGICNWVASYQTRQADQERAIADLQDKGAQSYAKKLDETLEKARDVMQQMVSLGRSLVEVLAQVLRAFSRQ